MRSLASMGDDQRWMLQAKRAGLFNHQEPTLTHPGYSGYPRLPTATTFWVLSIWERFVSRTLLASPRLVFSESKKSTKRCKSTRRDQPTSLTRFMERDRTRSRKRTFHIDLYDVIFFFLTWVCGSLHSHVMYICSLMQHVAPESPRCSAAPEPQVGPSCHWSAQRSEGQIRPAGWASRSVSPVVEV